MKKTFALTLALVGALSVSGCYTPQQQQGTLVGGALGAGGGALIGGLASHSVAGAVVGGVAGGFAGNAIARSEDCNRRTSHYRHRDRDYYVDRDGRRHYYDR